MEVVHLESLTFEYLREFSKKFDTVLGARVETDSGKKPVSKIS
jgi:hypothetical protein